MGNQIQVGQFAESDFMGNLARFSVTPVVAPGCLEFRQFLERAARKTWMHQHVLQTDDQAVSTEDRHKPGHAGGGAPDIRRKVVVMQSQCADILH